MCMSPWRWRVREGLHEHSTEAWLLSYIFIPFYHRSTTFDHQPAYIRLSVSCYNCPDKERCSWRVNETWSLPAGEDRISRGRLLSASLPERFFLFSPSVYFIPFYECFCMLNLKLPRIRDGHILRKTSLPGPPSALHVGVAVPWLPSLNLARGQKIGSENICAHTPFHTHSDTHMKTKRRAHPTSAFQV